MHPGQPRERLGRDGAKGQAVAELAEHLRFARAVARGRLLARSRSRSNWCSPPPSPRANHRSGGRTSEDAAEIAARVGGIAIAFDLAPGADALRPEREVRSLHWRPERRRLDRKGVCV